MCVCVCVEKDEAVNYIINKYSKLAQKSPFDWLGEGESVGIVQADIVKTNRSLKSAELKTETEWLITVAQPPN